MKLVGKNVLITGASSGIGSELARQLAVKGNNLALIARRKYLLDELASVIKTKDLKIFTYKCDVSVKEEVVFATNKILDDIGSIDVAILNAGTSSRSALNGIYSEEAENIFAVNVMGIIYFAEALIPHFKKRNEGTIAGISSLAESRGFPRSGLYCASKSAVSKLLESLRIEFRNYNIKVTIVKPGFVKTPMTDKNEFKMPFLMNVERAAKKILNGIEREKKIVQFPWPLVFGEKLTGIIPNSIFDFLAWKHVEMYNKDT